MQHVIETATDAAAVCFFDPKALPADFDQRVKKEAFEYLEELSKDGRVWTKNTGADGAYLFHFYIDEAIPENIAKFSEEPQTVDQFHVPGGTVCACGAEYAARSPLEGELKKFPQMGGCFDIPAGEYHTVVWRVEWPEGVVERELEKSLGKNFVRNNNRWGCLTVLLILFAPALTVFALIKTFLKSDQHPANYLACLWLVAVLAIAACVLLIRKVNRAEKNPLARKIQRNFPGIVVHMKKLTG